MELYKRKKQPIDATDLDIDMSKYLRPDELPTSATVTATAGLTIGATTIIDTMVRQRVSGGLNGVTYRVTLNVTTSAARVKQVDVDLLVKEV